MNKRAQVAVFVIIAVVIVGALVAFFAFRGDLGITSIPAELTPIFDYYTTCIDDAVRAGASLAGTQGGRIDIGEYTPGSDYAPFSSHLFFAGAQIPYWFSVAGNGVVQENIPTRASLEEELEVFVADQLSTCDFSLFQEQGFTITLSEPVVDITLNERSADARVSSSLSVSRGEVRASRATHDVQVATPLGGFLESARALYADQQENVYFETYAADFLRLYAPVDGVSIQCSPEVWKTREVFSELQNAFEANFAEIRFSTARGSSYFTIPHSSENTRVLYSREWPVFFEVSPADDELMVAEPVGNQKGLGVMGFCYVPYHFVYDLRFPVLVQLYEGEEVFQFPFVVIVDKNAPRNPVSTGVVEESERADICSFKEGSVSVSTFDTHLNPVEADIFYQCFDQRCSLGSTKLSGQTASLQTALPLCVNGQLIARADNFSETRLLFSSNSESRADLVMERRYSVQVEVLVDGRPTQESTIVHFTREDGSTVSALLPDQPVVALSEGLYNISSYVYGNSSITLPGITKQECTTVPRGGLSGFFGGTEERCFDVTTPETKIESALRGGGFASDSYLLESDLQTGRMKVYVSGLPAPTSLEQLQTNFELFDSAHLEVSFS